MDISTVLTYIKDLFATFMILLTMISPAFGNNVETYEAKNPDELIASFVAVSDIHVETNNPKTYNNFYNLLKGIKAGENIDAVIYTGDNVMNGQELENIFFYSAVKVMKPAEKNYVLAGNHDLGNKSGDFYALHENYLLNNKLYLGENLGNGYFYRVVNGCYLISLISEDPTSWEFVISEEQFAWLEAVLQEAQSEDAPILVFNHFPLYYPGGPGARLSNLLNQYGADLFLYGHYHNEIGADNFSTWNGTNIINLPRATEGSEFEPGIGVVIEVYEDEILVRTRDFIKGQWLEDLTYSYDY